MYQIEQLVQVAKRENNRRRSYLYVNPLQGKHIPADPEHIFEMCYALADGIEEQYATDKIIIIGFAETATAVSALVAARLKNVIGYLNTTREVCALKEILYFTESHSHATEQKLCVEGLAELMTQATRIVFVEDEVTTGNTICKLIRELELVFSNHHVKYTIASLLNSMSDERLGSLKQQRISCKYLCRIPYEYNIKSIEDYDEVIPCFLDYKQGKDGSLDIGSFKTSYINTRQVCDIKRYVDSVENLCREIKFTQEGISKNSVLVIGTEECMFPAIFLGKYLKDHGFAKTVKTHSTTRSPIMALDMAGYPLHKRYELCSVYDQNRTTYIYDLKKYDQVLIVTDTEDVAGIGLQNLVAALKAEGNEAITIYQWR